MPDERHELYSASAENKSKIIGYAEVFAIIHAHADRQLSLRVFVQGPAEIVVFQKKPNGSIPLRRENAFCG